jgi:hypothetical protein
VATSKWFAAPERPCSKCLNGQEKNKDSRNQNVSVELAIMQVRDDMNARREPSTIMLETSNECANFQTIVENFYTPWISCAGRFRDCLTSRIHEPFNRMRDALSLSPEHINVCVCSFSEDSDSLSQWRA